MTDRLPARAGALALLAAAAFVVEPMAASAQAAPPPSAAPPPAYPAPQTEPQNAPPGGYENNGWAYQQNYQTYRDQYAAWAGRNCVTQHQNNIAAGAIFGGVAGALLAGSIAGWAAGGAWVLFGGSLGLAGGAAVGAASSAPGCPNGYAVRAGAPPFYYSGPAYAYRPYSPAPNYSSYAPAGPAYGPSYGPAYRPYGGWTWDGYRWVRRPYYRPPDYRPRYYQPDAYGSY